MRQGMTLKTYPLFGAMAYALCQIAFAEEALQADPVVVTATRLATPIKTTLPHTTLIDQNDIRQSGARDIASILRQEAGLEITQDGGIGQRSSVFSRGTNSSHTLVLIDGVPINSATAGGAALDQIMLDQVDRIEIARGNLSSLYGSQAIGGVVQIFTKAGAIEPGASIHAGLGEYRMSKFGADYRFRSDALSLGISASTLTTKGYGAINEADVQAVPFPARDQDRDGYRNASVSADAKFRYAPGQSVGLTAFHSSGRTEFDDLFLGSNSSKPTLTSGALKFENTVAEIWKSRVLIGTGIDDSRIFNDGTPVNLFKTINEKLEWQNDFRVFGDDTIVVGVDYLRQQVDYDDGFNQIDRSRGNTAGFIGYLAKLSGGHHLQFNVRQDNYSDVGNRITGLLGGGFALTDRFTISASVSTAFRAPTFVDLYYPFGLGNPDLKPERARSAELGVQYVHANGLAKLVYFRNRLKDLIAFAGGTTVNINRAKSDGLELSYDAAFGDTTVRISATRQDAINQTSGERLLRRARQFASLRLGQRMGDWSFFAELVTSGNKLDIRVDDASRVRVPGYAILNLKSAYQLGKQTRFELQLDNVFDKRYQLAHGYNRERRNVSAGISHQF